MPTDCPPAFFPLAAICCRLEPESRLESTPLAQPAWSWDARPSPQPSPRHSQARGCKSLELEDVAINHRSPLTTPTCQLAGRKTGVVASDPEAALNLNSRKFTPTCIPCKPVYHANSAFEFPYSHVHVQTHFFYRVFLNREKFDILLCIFVTTQYSRLSFLLTMKFTRRL